MKGILHFFMLATTLMAVFSCKDNRLEPDPGPESLFDYQMVVLNDNYTEPLVLEGVTTLESIQKLENFPVWIGVSAQEKLNIRGRMVLNVTLKQDPEMTEDRSATGKVTLSNGKVITLEITQIPSLLDNTNASPKSSCNTAFEADWVSAESISLITSNVDINGRTEVSTITVPLPWDPDGLAESNIPQDIIEKMMIYKHDWALAFNLTGIEDCPDYNYFGMYNRITGKLRVFYYMQEKNIPDSDGSDHLWCLNFSTPFVEHVSNSFGLPYNTAFNSSIAEALGPDFITSALNDKDENGKVIPRRGWWAFDVDMSQLRKHKFSDVGVYDGITPSMLLYAQDNIILESVIEGGITGSMEGRMNMEALKGSSTTKAGQVCTAIFSGGLANFMGSGTLSALCTGKVDTSYAASGLAQAAVAAGLNFIGQMCQMDKTEVKGKDDLGKFSGTLDLKLNATMLSQGVITGARASNVAAPKMSVGYFNTDTHLGEGVWNIENTPVIYVVTDAYWGERMNFKSYKGVEDRDPETDALLRSGYSLSIDPNLMGLRLICFLDPTSLGSIVVNESVFPDAQPDVVVGWGVYPENTDGYTDGLRRALGLEYKSFPLVEEGFAKNYEFDTSKDKMPFRVIKKPNDDTIFINDIEEGFENIIAPRLSEQSLKTGNKTTRRYFGNSLYYTSTTADRNTPDIVRFVNDPQIYLPVDSEKHYLYNPEIPDFEVMVNVCIGFTENGEPAFVQLERSYIPEIRLIKSSQVGTILQEIKERRKTIPSEVVYKTMKPYITTIEEYEKALK